MNSLLRISACVLALGLGLSVRGANLSPNIVLMMADDMGMGDTSAYQDLTGNPDEKQIATPQMDRLARMGLRFADAHTPSTRCTATRYGLMTGRYPWRSRMKHWVLYGSQGDPLIEADRPTLATVLRAAGYRTGLVGKWHVGLRYRRSDGSPAAGWKDADLTQPLHTTPLDHGFDFVRFTSRSHGTSGPDLSATKGRRANGPKQAVGPGHIHGRVAIGATGNGKALVTSGSAAYVLSELGGRHSDSAIEFLNQHVQDASTRESPFFLYYPSNSNHGPHTPDQAIGGRPVAEHGKSVSGERLGVRCDYVYENDVALGRLIDWLEATEDPRRPGRQLIENTIVIFTSDNGAEIRDPIASGPFRSNKASVYEGGHRVPFIMAWPLGQVGDGRADTAGLTTNLVIGLQDLYATFSAILGRPMPNWRAGEKGGEDSVSFWERIRSGEGRTEPILVNDHKEAGADPAVLALRVDSPRVGDRTIAGQWKILFGPELLRQGVARPVELYDLATDQQETRNRLAEPGLKALVDRLTLMGLQYRRSGGHCWVDALAPGTHRLEFGALPSAVATNGNPAQRVFEVPVGNDSVQVMVGATSGRLDLGDAGLGVTGGAAAAVESNEAVLLTFNHDVVVEWAEVVAGDGVCGGYYQVGDGAPLAIYCTDGDNDDKDQHGVLSDIGLVRAGEPLRLASGRHYGVEPAGRWRLRAVQFSLLD